MPIFLRSTSYSIRSSTYFITSLPTQNSTALCSTEHLSTHPPCNCRQPLFRTPYSVTNYSSFVLRTYVCTLLFPSLPYTAAFSFPISYYPTSALPPLALLSLTSHHSTHTLSFSHPQRPRVILFRLHLSLSSFRQVAFTLSIISTSSPQSFYSDSSSFCSECFCLDSHSTRHPTIHPSSNSGISWPFLPPFPRRALATAI